jgi:phosphatidylglycerophosphate synthase
MVAKQVADLITFTRGLIAIGLVWVGLEAGGAGLFLAAWMMLADWIGDMLDGRIARRSQVQYRTWIGDHDLQVDMTVSVGLLIFMLQANFLSIWLAGVYLFLWVLYFGWQRGIPHSQGMLFQAPIYGWFIWISLRYAPLAGWSLVIFLAAVILITWPYFPTVMVPGFLNGLHHTHD